MLQLNMIVAQMRVVCTSQQNGSDVIRQILQIESLQSCSDPDTHARYGIRLY